MQQSNLEDIKAYVDKRFVYRPENLLRGGPGLYEQLQMPQKRVYLSIESIGEFFEELKEDYEISSRQK